MFWITQIGKLPNGKIILTESTYSRKGNLLPPPTHWDLGCLVEFMRLGDVVLIDSELIGHLEADWETIIAQGMTYETGWSHDLIGLTLKDIMDEGLVYDENLKPKG